MEKQKVYTKVVFLLFVFCHVVNVSAQDFNKMHIGAEVNGKLVDGELVLHDTDSCTFFLLDEQGCRMTCLPQGDNYSLTWNLCFKSIYGDVWKKNLNGGKRDSIVGISVYPDSFDVLFVNDKIRRNNLSYRTCCQVGEITCDLKIGLAAWYVYTIPVFFDVLPPEPHIEIIDNYIEQEESSEPFPVVILSITADNFDKGLLWVDDADINFMHSGDSFSSSTEMPFIVKADFATERCGFWCEVSNDYGISGSDEVFPDWSQTAIWNATVKDGGDIKVLCGHGFCHVTSESIMRSVCVTDAKGRTVYSSQNQSDVIIPLARGLYIVTIVKLDGEWTRRKILIR